ncbi:MAG: DUF2202 domain-containing protein [Acidimicrobiia bacterium]
MSAHVEHQHRTHDRRARHGSGPSPTVRRPRRLLALLGLLAATSLTAVACGGGDEGTATATTTARAAAITVAADASAPVATVAAADTTAAPAPTTTTAAGATTTAADATTTAAVAADAVAGLSADEVASLVWMREEEKLARDVYTTLGELWGVQIFDNIAASEQSHTDAVLRLLDAYGIADPAAGAPVGVFSDPALQQLHDELVAKGSLSLTDALAVGATIEDLDIVDLQERATEVADIDAVYAELEKGSRNHLRAFVSQLEAQGGGYSPQYLSPEAYTAIVTSATERGPAAR